MSVLFFFHRLVRRDVMSWPWRPRCGIPTECSPWGCSVPVGRHDNGGCGQSTSPILPHGVDPFPSLRRRRQRCWPTVCDPPTTATVTLLITTRAVHAAASRRACRPGLRHLWLMGGQPGCVLASHCLPACRASRSRKLPCGCGRSLGWRVKGEGRHSTLVQGLRLQRHTLACITYAPLPLRRLGRSPLP